MPKPIQLLVLLFMIVGPLWGQSIPSTGEEIFASYEMREQMAGSSWLKDYPARSIGPVVQGGRVSDLAVTSNPAHYYVAYASGGVFKTTNNGVTFEPIFDEQGALGIGDMALAPSNNDIIYVGTGENNSSRSSYAGSGVYKSSDQGASWEYLGLSDIQHTGRVIVHPQDPDVVWVAATGALYSHDPHRGVYKSTDGGKNWKKTLFVNDSTGIIDLLINPDNPDQLWATSWERTRYAWNFKGQGPGSAVYRSDNGGESWQKLVNGLPQNEYVGRIGVDLCQSQPNVLYALIDNQEESKTPKKVEPGMLQAKDFLDMTKETFAKLDTAVLNQYLKDNRFPAKYDAIKVKDQIGKGEYAPKALADYLGDANRALFDTKVTGAELYRSDDFGDTWEKVNSYELEGVYFTYGYYFGEVRVAPDNPDVAYVFGVPLLSTRDGGKTFQRLDTIGNVHVDHQALWIDPQDSQHILLGNDGGLYLSYDAGANWLHLNNTSVGQFYTVNVDFEKPYNVYGGLQDNGVLMGSSKSVPNRTKKWQKVFGGDGMFVSADPRNSQLIYTGFQFGNYYRINRKTGKRQRITPQHDIGEDVLRFNWRTPVVLSRHNADILYFGSQKLHRSLDQGESWETISEDLTKDKPQGNVPFSTITCISESPLKFGLIYVGTDDGNIQVTRGGGAWTLISESLPQQWISSIHPSTHDENRVYVSMNGYRNDHFNTYIYYSDDHGDSWHSLKGNLPEVVVNVIKQDPVNPDLLYLGTDHGAYVSFDHGTTWQYVNQIPNVAVYDLMIHPRDNELVLATHGRSMYILDVNPWQKLQGDKLGGLLVLYGVKDKKYSKDWGERRYPWSKPNLPHQEVLYFVSKPVDLLKMVVKDQKGTVLRELEVDGSAGFHHISWDLKSHIKKKRELTEDYLKPGTYTLSLTAGSISESVEFQVKESNK